MRRETGQLINLLRHAAINLLGVAKGKTILSIVDQSDLDVKIPRSQWQWIQIPLCNAFLDVLKEKPGLLPQCSDAGWFHGAVKLIACDDDRSAELYKAAVSKLGEVYPGAKLEACEAADVSSSPRVLNILKTCGS